MQGEDDGMEEFGVPFRHAPSLDTYTAIHRQVLIAYEYRCALTGARFAPIAGLHPFLSVVPIQPRELGGPLHVANFLPLSEAAARAFAADHFLIADDFSITVDHAVIDRTLASRIEPRLRVPADPLYRPDPVHLAFRRRLILGR